MPDRYDPAHHVAGCMPYHLHDLAQLCWVGSVLQYTDPAQRIIAAGHELVDLDR